MKTLGTFTGESKDHEVFSRILFTDAWGKPRLDAEALDTYIERQVKKMLKKVETESIEAPFMTIKGVGTGAIVKHDVPFIRPLGMADKEAKKIFTSGDWKHTQRFSQAIIELNNPSSFFYQSCLHSVRSELLGVFKAKTGGKSPEELYLKDFTSALDSL